MKSSPVECAIALLAAVVDENADAMSAAREVFADQSWADLISVVVVLTGIAGALLSDFTPDHRADLLQALALRLPSRLGA